MPLQRRSFVQRSGEPTSDFSVSAQVELALDVLIDFVRLIASRSRE